MRNMHGDTFGQHRLADCMQRNLQFFQADAPLNDDQTVLLLAREKN
jgi:hypothetical protein